MADPLKPSTPLPPGVVPSESRDDFESLVNNEAANVDDRDPKNLVKEGVLDSKATQLPSTAEAPEVKAISETPSHAWISPEKQAQKFQIDLSADEADESSQGATVIQVIQDKEEESRFEEAAGATSPFVSSKPSIGQQPPDLRKEVIQGGKSNGLQPVTPKRSMSPLKRHNKVAPSPVKPPAAAMTSAAPPTQLTRSMAASAVQSSSLQSNSASLLEEKRFQSEAISMQTERSGSAPNLDEIDGKDKKVNVAKPITLEPVVVVKSKNGDLVVQDWESQYRQGQQPSPGHAEPQYSSVVKNKPRRLTENETFISKSSHATQPAGMITTVLPCVDAYKPQPKLDTSIVVTNPTATESEAGPTGQGLPQDRPSHDPDYEDIDSGYKDEAILEANLPQYNPALYKGLKKHDNQERNVHLVSLKGTGQLSENEPIVNFPPSSSADMHPLHYAAATGNKKKLTELISILPITQDPVEMILGTEKMCKRDGIDVRDSEGRTPLMHAVHQDHIHCVKVLAEVGANVNSAANDGSTCLHQAAYTGSLGMIALLLSIGADGLKRDKDGRLPLHWCTNNKDPKTIEILLDKVPGLNINIRDGAMMTALMWAAFHGKPSHIKMLLENGADPSLKDVDGMTAAHWSIQRHDTRALQVLINRGSTEFTTNKGKTVMHQAAEQGCAKAVSLIKFVRPTSVNDADINGRTPLHWATVCENPEVIRALMLHGAEPNIKDNSQKTALDYANEKGLHYCSILLTNSENLLEDVDNYGSIFTYGSSTTAPGARALQQQEGQRLDEETLKKSIKSEQVLQIQTVCRGAWMNKFTNDGKGPLHPRFFWVNPSNCKICWSKSKDRTSKDVKSDTLVGVRSSASPAVFGRKDFDPVDKHKFAFTIFTNLRVIDVVAVSSEDYKTWLNGLQLLLHLGSINTTKILSFVQSSSGRQLEPIP